MRGSDLTDELQRRQDRLARIRQARTQTGAETLLQRVSDNRKPSRPGPKQVPPAHRIHRG